MGNTRNSRSGASGQGRRRSDEEREALRERRRAYYEQLSPEEKRAYREKRLRRKQRKKRKKMLMNGAVMLALIIVSVIGILIQQGGKKKPSSTAGSATQSQGEAGNPAVATPAGAVTMPEWVTQDLIRVNQYSRPGTKLAQINGVVVHYVANAGSTAKQNRDYFDGLADSGETSVSSHFVIDIDGTILQCVPLEEIAYASNKRNDDTVSIECCHPDDTGKFSDATYDSLVKLVKWLEQTYNLKPESVIRHHDVSGKNCPLYFVEHEDAWEQFHRDIALE